MQIIPVIDVMRGKVVHASGGVRSQYSLLQSVLTSHCEPLLVIADLLAWHSFTTIYIADLDAIVDQKRNIKLYDALTKRFPDVTFWLDAGITSKKCWQDLCECKNIKLVIGSETLSEIEWLAEADVQERSIVSLDFKQGQFLGNRQLLEQPELWPENVIAMNIDYVGAQSGPDYKLLSALQQKSIHSQIIAAGGVRTELDLINLERQGIRHALVASALHDGRIK